MASVPIDSKLKFIAWLTKNPLAWSQIIASRGALRILPKIGLAEDRWLMRFALVPIRACAISWAARSFPGHDMTFAAKAAYRARIAHFSSNIVNAATLQVVKAANITSFNDQNHNRYYNHQKSSVPAYAEQAAIAAAFPADEVGNWDCISRDCQLLDSAIDSPFLAPTHLAKEPLWYGNKSLEIAESWSKLARKLQTIDPNYAVWIDWYERRIRGEHAAFDIPGDQNRAEDKAILVRLAEATDEDFWGKGHKYVNATLKGWLDEARARVAPPPIIAEASGTFEINGFAEATLGPTPLDASAKLPGQNINAISFRADENGKISIDTIALADQLRTDAGAQDRHAEAIAEAKIVFDRCQRSNAGARLTRLFENYLAAAGEAVDDVKPSLLVQRGERLRQELSAYQNPDSFLDPLADDLLLDMKGWQSAHNMMVGLDPVLNAMDVATLGPDKQPALISPDEIKEKAREAHEAELLQNGVLEIIVETADLAPAIPDPADRHTIWSTEMVRNLMIETASIAFNNPLKTGAIIAVCAGGGIVGGISIMGSIKAAEYLVNHRDWMLARLGNTPTWQALIAQLANWLEKNTPFQPK